MAKVKPKNSKRFMTTVSIGAAIVLLLLIALPWLIALSTDAPQQTVTANNGATTSADDGFPIGWFIVFMLAIGLAGIGLVLARISKAGSMLVIASIGGLSLIFVGEAISEWLPDTATEIPEPLLIIAGAVVVIVLTAIIERKSGQKGK